MGSSEKSGGKDKAAILMASMPCSICLDLVSDVGDRSVAKLKCGHSFHLDCIGSAFNAKGIMQCPNCRDIEDGNWLYANGSTPQEDAPFEDLVYEDDYDIYGVSEFILANEDTDNANWCPYQSSYSQFSVSLEEVEPSPSGYPEVVVNVVYGDIISGCPFAPSNDSRSPGNQLGYDSVLGAMRYGQNGSSRVDAVGTQNFASADNRNWSHPMFPVSNVSLLEESRLNRFMPIDERRFPHHVADIRVHQRSVDASSSYSVWSEPYTQAPIQAGTGRPFPMVSFRSAPSTNPRRWRNRGPGQFGRSLQSHSHPHLNWGMVNSAGQELGIPSIPETNWQGDQGIPWRRDGFSLYPWAASDAESHRWTTVGPSSSQSSYFGMQDLASSQMPSVPAYQGYPSVFQHDRVGDISSVNSHSIRPLR